jgi:hypothetical protein
LPLILTTPIAPTPGAVAIAAMVCWLENMAQSYLNGVQIVVVFKARWCAF